MKTKIVKNRGQQGDIIMRRLSKMPQGERKLVARGRCVVAHGESGHSHVVEQDDAELIEIGGKMLLVLETAADMKHEEHRAETYAPGIWEIGQVREKNWFTEMVAPVVD